MNKTKIVDKAKLIHYILAAMLIIVSLNLLSSKSELAFRLIGYRGYIVLTESMQPNISPGDIVIVKNINRTKIKDNDVITFNQYNEIITHRVSKTLLDGYITKGDNNRVEDQKIYKEDIIGKVVFTIPILGKVIMLLSNEYILSLELILLGGIIILNRLR